MEKTFGVHYGRPSDHLVEWEVLDKNFRSLDTAKRAARALEKKGYAVIIADTDGGEWYRSHPD